MPTTINGIGTGYWGKKNKVSVYGECGSCGEHAMLTSYDTRNCFVILFIPVLPLGGRHIVDDCSACRRHSYVSARKWTAMREEVLTEAINGFKASPTDPEKASALIGAIIGLRDREALVSAGPALLRAVGSDPELTAGLIGAFELFGLHDAAERGYHALLALTPEDHLAREQYAVHLASRGRATEAAGEIEQLIAAGHIPGVPSVLHIVHGLQAEGAHVEALRLIDRFGETVPEANELKEFQKAEIASGKHRQTGKRLKRRIAPDFPANRDSNRLTALMPVAIPILLLLGFLFLAFSTSRETEVYLVNGAGTTYVAEVAGEEHLLEPGKPRLVRVPPGALEIAYENAIGERQDVRVPIEIGFFEGLFGDKIHVVNPDRAAIILWEKTIYSEETDNDYEVPTEYHAASLSHEFDGIDYVFRPFPMTVTINTDSDRTYRERVSLVSATAPDWYGHLLNLDRTRATAVLNNLMRFEPGNESWPLILPRVAGPEAAITALKPYLARRPLLMSLHRAYQGLLEIREPEELRREYDAYLRAEPDNKALSYLRARLIPDPIERRKAFLQAAGEEGASPMVYYGLAYGDLIRGRFDEAHAWSVKALAGDPDSQSFNLIHDSILLAAGRHDELFDRLSRQELNTGDYQSAIHRVRWSRAMGREADLGRLAARVASGDSRQQVIVQQVLETMDAYAMGDRNLFLEHAEELDIMAFQRHLFAGRWEAAGAIAAETGNPVDYLSIATMAHHRGALTAAAEARAAASSLLQNGDMSQRRLARLMIGNRNEAESILDAIASQDLVIMALIDAGQRFPELEATCFARARKLNFDPEQPYLVARTLLQ